MSIHARLAAQESVVPPRSRFYQGLFGRLFPDLEPWLPVIGGTNAPSDVAADQFFKDIAANQMIEPTSGPDLDSTIPAAYTYFGQFVDHDITFDPASSLVRQNDPQMLHNFRTPRLDLDNVYGSGPNASPHLYAVDGKDQPIGKFIIGTGANPNETDLPRNQLGKALIGDPRNDENVIVSQLQLAFLKFHNLLFENLKAGGGHDDDSAYREARRILTWTYQYVVWHDFVKRIVNEDVWSAVLKKETKAGITRWKLDTQFYDWKNTPFIPVEFSVAAYRFGHSLVRTGYQLNIEIGVGNEVRIFSLPTPANPNPPAQDLRGGRPLPVNHSLQWDWFLQLPSSGGPFPQHTRKIDQFLSQSLASIPAGPGGANALAFLNLKRGWRMGLPSGPDVARYMGLTPIATAPDEEALWFYILKEAGTLPGVHRGNMLGRVGSTIVSEVFAGLLYGDPYSYLNLRPTWTPAQEPLFAGYTPLNGDWELADIIRMAGMPEDGGQLTALVTTGSFMPKDSPLNP